ncbi:hypothetical protein GIB67_022095 [Kingdonia uniflora]|uniref:F-box domain-containing protein n=1 Tax=Kingdonia uniflora TaxID=39325 RepID=A0A7J7L2I4_9MAGN|nr:hypothetical protein GIB67_022095 [Kingdonia uniflora]
MANNECPYLPKDIITKILMRVPIEAVIAFKLVCVLWFKLISDPSFLKEHLLRNSKPNIMILKIQLPKHSKNIEYEHFSVNFDQKRGIALEELPLQHGGTFFGDKVELVASCNVLLLLQSQDRILQLYVCNPYSRRCIVVPPLKFNYLCHWALVQDVSTQRYKVVGISFIYNRYFVLTLGNRGQGDMVWRQVNGPLLPSLNVTSGKFVFAYGNMHWLCDGLRISSLDVAKEDLWVMQGPPCKQNHWLCCLSEANGSLYITCPSISQDQLQIWHLSDRSSGIWVKEYVINIRSIVDKPPSLVSFWFCLCTFLLQTVAATALTI